MQGKGKAQNAPSAPNTQTNRKKILNNQQVLTASQKN
jgi:hypothetical protein